MSKLYLAPDEDSSKRYSVIQNFQSACELFLADTAQSYNRGLPIAPGQADYSKPHYLLSGVKLTEGWKIDFGSNDYRRGPAAGKLPIVKFNDLESIARSHHLVLQVR